VSDNNKYLVTGPHGHYFQHINLGTFPTAGFCMIVDAPWFISNTVIRKYLEILTVNE
jgi:hypothetical protein